MHAATQVQTERYGLAPIAVIQSGAAETVLYASVYAGEFGSVLSAALIAFSPLPVFPDRSHAP